MKINECKQFMRKQGISAAIFTNFDASRLNPSYFYFTQNESLGILLLPAKGRPKLIVPEMELEKARTTSFLTVKLDSSTIDKVFADLKGVIGIDYDSITQKSLLRLKKKMKGCRVKDISNHLAMLRLTKTTEEIRKIRRACRITDAIFSGIVKHAGQFASESDIAAFIESEIRKEGASPSFEPTVASGKAASIPHYRPKRVPIRKGFMVIDFGVRFKGYCSDMTRTIYFGKASPREKQIYHKVLSLQEKAIKMLRPGMKADEPDTFVRSELKERFFHSLGHGIGLEVHELPALSPKSKITLTTGMVFTIEPGYYIPGKMGIRIEDDVYLSDKPQILTRSSKELIII